MRNDARPIGEQFRDIAEHSAEKDHEPAEGARPSEDARGAANEKPVRANQTDRIPGQSDR
jgi:hypothetical protein